MSQPNEINKIFINEGIELEHIDNTLLAFSDGLILPKSSYSIVEHAINTTTQAESFLSLYYFKSTAGYFEYSIDLRTVPVTITGLDKNGQALTGLTSSTPLIFVNGRKLQPGEYEITANNTFVIYSADTSKQFSSVIIYCGSDIVSLGSVMASRNWDPKKKTLIIQGNTIDRYIFFLNGKAIRKDVLQLDVDGTLHFNLDINADTDYLEYYRLPENAVSLIFDADPGYFAFGPKDKYSNTVPELYDTILTFKKHIARLAIDDLRYGFFVREVDSDGCLMIVDEDYEHYTVKCLTVSPFTKTELTETEFYVQVPDAKSILHYVSEFDLSQKLFPELLGSFQKVLLNETYDSIQRIKNLRSLYKVNSTNINNLIDFLGFDQRITDMPLEQKHHLLEELNDFYKIAGTRASYNFYNIISADSKILDIEQLFTPIRDKSTVDDWEPGVYYIAGKSTIVTHEGEYYYCKETHTSADTWAADIDYWVHTTSDAVERRYVTFYNAEDLGAQYKSKYDYPYVDYGKIGQLANPTDILSNELHGTGKLQDDDRVVRLPCYDLNGKLATYPIITPSGEWRVYDTLTEDTTDNWRPNTFYYGGVTTVVKVGSKFYCCKDNHTSLASWEAVDPSINKKESDYWIEVKVKPTPRFITPNAYNPTHFKVGPNKATEGYDRGYVPDFEYKRDFSAGYTLVEGNDDMGNALDGLNTAETQVFMNGYKLRPEEYTILSPKLLLIIGKYKRPSAVYLEARTFIPADGINEEDYASYYYMVVLNEENKNCYNSDGTSAMGAGIYSSYQIQWRKVDDHVEYYLQTSSTTEKVIGIGRRAATLDRYTYTDNISCPYSSVSKAFNGDVSYSASREITDYSFTLNNGDITLEAYQDEDTEGNTPRDKKTNVTWYINPENTSLLMSKTYSHVLYPIFDNKGNRVYYGSDNAPVYGVWLVDNEGTNTDILFGTFTENNQAFRILGYGTRTPASDIKVEKASDNIAQLDIWKSDMIPTNIYDYGYVYEQIKGEWIEWFEWDRPKDWYPTNHVNVSLEIPADANYDEFINEFKKTFYDIASTVLYIHSIINVYTFGYNKNNFGIMTAPTYHTIEETLTNNPTIQPFTLN